MRLTTCALLFLGIMCSSASHVHADGYATDSQGRVFQIVPAKKSSTLLGKVTVVVGKTSYTPSLTDLALSAKKGMYGITYSELIKINMTTPSKSTQVGSLGVTCNALAFDEDHNLWAIGGSHLYRVSLITGRATLVGSFGIVGTSDGDLAFVGKVLYGTLSTSAGSALVTINTKTGKATRVGIIRTAKGKAIHSVWGLIWNGRRMFGLTQSGAVFGLDLKKAIITPIFATGTTYWGACPMLRM